MRIDRGPVALKSGEEARLYQIVAPQPDWKDRILPFLAHKGPNWLWAMEAALESDLPGLRSSFFELVLGEDIVGNITTVESLDPPIGILQHVFTLPEHRRQGICQALMQALGDDFAARGGRAMYLGTGYDSPAYWIYHSFGFRGIGETGAMRRVLDEDFDARYFAPGEVTVRDAGWADWPLLEALYLVEEGWYLRSFRLGGYGHCSFEGPYVELAALQRAGAVSASKVMATGGGAVVGHAMLAVQEQWQGYPHVLDFFVHPTFEAQAAALLRDLDYPAGRKVQCYCDAEATGKMAALEAAGFQREAVLTGQIERAGEAVDVAVYARA